MIALAEAVRDTFAVTEQSFRAWLTRTRQPSCSKGCAACCELLTLVTWLDAVLLAEVLRERDLVQEVLPKLVAQAELATFVGVDPVKYFERRIPCALLAADRTCRVYDARPLTCRLHVTFTPAAMCEDRTPGTATEQLDQAPVLAEVVGPMLLEVGRQGFPDAWVFAPLPVMVLAALRELGEEVPPTITPREWAERHGEHAQVEVRTSLREARAAGGRR